jgi:transcriptional regulator with XRE-family HTH domain
MARAARSARAQIPKRGLGLGSAVRRIRELHGIGQEALAERSGLSQGYLSQIESGSWTAVTEDALGRIANALGVEPWVILAQAAGLKLDDVERFTEDERIWLDAFRALDAEQRETILRVAAVMRRPSPRRRGR